MGKKFYSDWTQAQILALVLKGIRSGRIKDQTVLNTDANAEEMDMVPLSEIIASAIQIKQPA